MQHIIRLLPMEPSAKLTPATQQRSKNIWVKVRVDQIKAGHHQAAAHGAERKADACRTKQQQSTDLSCRRDLAGFRSSKQRRDIPRLLPTEPSAKLMPAGQSHSRAKT
jgi:hypothetical protein